MHPLPLILGGSVISTGLLAWPGHPQDRKPQGVESATYEAKQIQVILTAKDASKAAAGYGTLFKSNTADGLGRSGEPKQAVRLGLAEFQELKSILDIKKQPWATSPWKYSITEARKLAAASKKPIFMVVNTGNALGCT